MIRKHSQPAFSSPAVYVPSINTLNQSFTCNFFVDNLWFASTQGRHFSVKSSYKVPRTEFSFNYKLSNL